MSRERSRLGARSYAWLIPLAAVIAVLPLVLDGSSCGKDFTFHLQSWLDAAGQFRHGTLYPRWTLNAAYNAGEPRFIFYPPLSWMLGGWLTLLLPFQAVPTVLTWLVLCLAGFTMHRLLRRYASQAAALVGSSLFIANPFMMFSIASRNAYGEILAAAWCPLLFAAMLEDEPTVWSVGAPIALMWLSNVPGGVIGTYLFLLLAVLRLLAAAPGNSAQGFKKVRSLLRVYGAGLIFGLSLAAVYLVPAIHERPHIHMSDAFTPGMTVADNLVLHRALDPVRDAFLIRVEHIAGWMALFTVLALATAWWLLRGTAKNDVARRRALRLTGAVALAAMFLITSFSGPIWKMLPALWVVQFPWRLLFVLGICMAIGAALILRAIPLRMPHAAIVSLALVALLAFPELRAFNYTCGAGDEPAAVRQQLERHHSLEPTDEYVLASADQTNLRPDNPPFWLSASPEAYAPGTTPNMAGIDPQAEMPSVPPDAKLAATPLKFSVSSLSPAYLVVNLSAYPNWRVFRNGDEVKTRLSRPDGLIAIAVPTGASDITIAWHHSWDEWVGLFLTLTAIAAWLAFRRRRKSPMLIVNRY